MVESKLLTSLAQDGIVMQSLLGDLLAFFIMSYVTLKLVVPAVKYGVKAKRTYDKIGGPTPHPIYGSLDKYPYTGKGLVNLRQRCADYPKMAVHWVSMFFQTVHVYHPDTVQPVLTRNYPKPLGYKKNLGMLLGNGLVVANGSHWKRHRRMLTAVFHFDIIKNHVIVFNEGTKNLLKAFGEYAKSGKVCDIVLPVNRATYQNTMKCVFSRDEDDPIFKDASFSQHLWEVNKLIIYRMNTPILWVDMVWNLTAARKKFEHHKKVLHGMLGQIIDERRMTLMNSDETVEEKMAVDREETGKGREVETFRRRKGQFVDFLDILIQGKDELGCLTHEEIKDEMITFFGAGQETVAHSMNWTLYNLAQNKDWQQKCREEIMEIVGDNEVITSQEESRLKVLTMCIKEAMRLYPVLHHVGRQVDEDVLLRNGVTLEKGMTVGINIYSLHRNPIVWEDADVYNPNRFLPDNSSKRSPFAFIPFAAGPRNCIGSAFAMHQMRVTMAHALRSFEFYIDDECDVPRLNPCVTLMCEDGIQIKMRKAPDLH